MKRQPSLRLSDEQILSFRLARHHLMPGYEPATIPEAFGGWVMPNTPPGAWMDAMFARMPSASLQEADRLLSNGKRLLQAWSFRGVPCVFPMEDRALFLSALIPQREEAWLYTNGIQLALDALHMSQEELLPYVERAVSCCLEDQTILSKASLDQVLADEIRSHLPGEKRPLWDLPSCYGANQTMGEAAVSFLLRPCSLKGLVVFGKREGRTPAFTSFANWAGPALSPPPANPSDEICSALVVRYLQLFAPATADMFAQMAGVSPGQARRLWSVASETASLLPVLTDRGKAFILEEDLPAFEEGTHRMEKIPFQHSLRPLFPHDPYLELRDRKLILPSASRSRQVWQTVSNPGVILVQGRIVGFFRLSRASSSFSVTVSIWEHPQEGWKEILEGWFSRYAAFCGRKLQKIDYAVLT